jgi:hypothetical protein
MIQEWPERPTFFERHQYDEARNQKEQLYAYPTARNQRSKYPAITSQNGSICWPAIMIQEYR